MYRCPYLCQFGDATGTAGRESEGVKAITDGTHRVLFAVDDRVTVPGKSLRARGGSRGCGRRSGSVAAATEVLASAGVVVAAAAAATCAPILLCRRRHVLPAAASVGPFIE